VQKEKISKKLTLCYENGSFECFWQKIKGLRILGVKWCIFVLVGGEIFPMLSAIM